MRRFGFIFGLVICTAVHPFSVPQLSGNSENEPGALLVKLAEPVYPRLAQQARITGTVGVQIRVRDNGTVESATAVSGHPMLRQAAVDSARQSRLSGL